MEKYLFFKDSALVSHTFPLSSLVSIDGSLATHGTTQLKFRLRFKDQSRASGTYIDIAMKNNYDLNGDKVQSVMRAFTDVINSSKDSLIVIANEDTGEFFHPLLAGITTQTSSGTTFNVQGTLNSTGSVTAVGIHDTNLITQAGTAAEDLSAVSANTTLVILEEQAGEITLPAPTSANVGMVVKVIFMVDGASAPYKIGVDESGDFYLVGYLELAANNAADAIVSLAIPALSKSLLLDADDVTGAGGASGSVYTFTYVSTVFIYCEAKGRVTTGAVAPDASSFSSSGTNA